MRTSRLIVWIFLSFCLLPWTSAETQRLTREEFQAKKNAYIVQQASLSEKESAQFFPLYREMRRKIGRINREISRQERELSKVGCYSEARYKEAMDRINNSRIEAAKIEKEYTETGYQDTRFQQKEAMESRRSAGQTGDGAEASGSGTAGTSDFHTAGSKADFSRNKADSAGSQSNGSQDPNRTLKIVLLVIAAVLTSPLWLAVLGTLAGMLLGVVGTVIGILLAFSVTVLVFYLLGFLFGGISVSIFAAGGIASGLGLLGSGLILLALALAGTVGCVWLYGKFLPWMFRGIALLCRRLFQGRRSAA